MSRESSALRSTGLAIAAGNLVARLLTGLGRAVGWGLPRFVPEVFAPE